MSDVPFQTTCILCGTNEYARVLYPSNVEEGHLNATVFSARRAPDRLHATIVKCGKCGLVYPTELIDTAKLSSLYEQSKYTYAGEERHIRRTYKRYLRKLLSFLKQVPPTKDSQTLWGRNVSAPQGDILSYLDIGCGNGFMLMAAREVGFEDAWGIEPSKHAIEQADPAIRSNIIQGMFSAETLQGKKFDALSCFQTLDHIPDPVTFVEECLKILKPGGAVLFINHNIESYTSRLLGERCPMIDIEHTYLHTPETMRELFSRSGFTDIRVFAVRNDYPLHYWAHLLPGPTWFKRFMSGFLRVTGLGRLILPLYAGNLGLMATKT